MSQPLKVFPKEQMIGREVASFVATGWVTECIVRKARSGEDLYRVVWNSGLSQENSKSYWEKYFTGRVRYWVAGNLKTAHWEYGVVESEAVKDQKQVKEANHNFTDSELNDYYFRGVLEDGSFLVGYVTQYNIERRVARIHDPQTGTAKTFKFEDMELLFKSFKATYPSDQSKSKKPDMVNHPPHYNRGKVECIDCIEAALTPEQFVGFLRGTILKYEFRLGAKGSSVEDSDKAAWYRTRLREKLEKENNDAE